MGNYLSTLVERWIELIAMIVMIGIWRCFIGHTLRDKLRDEFKSKTKKQDKRIEELKKHLELSSPSSPVSKSKSRNTLHSKYFAQPSKRRRENSLYA